MVSSDGEILKAWVELAMHVASQRRVLLVIAASLMLVVVIVGSLMSGAVEQEPELHPTWTSETASSTSQNRFSVGALQTGETTLVIAPISGRRESPACGLFALAGKTGTVVWNASIPPANCIVNPVTAPTIADFDEDGTREILVVAAGGQLFAYEPMSGRQELRVSLTIPHGNPSPVVANLTSVSTPDIIVTGPDGVVRVFGPNGTVRWRRDVGEHVFARPRIRDFDVDGESEVVVATTDGGLSLLTRNGTVEWQHNVTTTAGDTITWVTTGSLDSDRAVELVAGTTDGTVAVVDSRNGRVQWRRSVGKLAAVRAVFDGDIDGVPEVYVTAADGTLRSLNGPAGTVEWRQPLTNRSVQMTPPPVAGDLDADGSREIVVVTNDGTVLVLNPRTGRVLASVATNRTVYASPTIANIDRDRASEILVIYGNGKVTAFSYRERLRVRVPSVRDVVGLNDTK